MLWVSEVALAAGSLVVRGPRRTITSRSPRLQPTVPRERELPGLRVISRTPLSALLLTPPSKVCQTVVTPGAPRVMPAVAAPMVIEQQTTRTPAEAAATTAVAEL